MRPDASTQERDRAVNLGGSVASSIRITQSPFGALACGSKIQLYTLANARGITCQVMSLGASITQLNVPDRQGKLADVVLGYTSSTDYLQSDSYAGATVGRVANRIARARFIHDHSQYHLAANDGVNHLHGGVRGFDKVVWTAFPEVQKSGARLVLTYLSRDGEEGYPGTLSAKVIYTLTDQDQLQIDYEAVTDKPTPVNLTNHTYFNLAGTGDILNHLLAVNADNFTPLDHAHLPTGEIATVAGTTADFRSATRIGTRLSATGNGMQGFNHNFVLNDGGKQVARAARLHEPTSGRALEIWTNQPGLQLYTGQYLRSSPVGKYGAIYKPYSGICLEPQFFPDAVNHARFPSTILYPGTTYRHRTIWKFSCE